MRHGSERETCQLMLNDVLAYGLRHLFGWTEKKGFSRDAGDAGPTRPLGRCFVHSLSAIRPFSAREKGHIRDKRAGRAQAAGNAFRSSKPRCIVSNAKK
jgi:hypothetical protein